MSVIDSCEAYSCTEHCTHTPIGVRTIILLNLASTQSFFFISDWHGPRHGPGQEE